MKRIYNTFRITLLIIALTACSAGAKVEGMTVTTVAPKQVKTGETFQVQYTVTSDKDFSADIKINKAANLEIKSGPHQSKSARTNMINGEKSFEYSVTFTYFLVADSKGKYKLPTAEIRINSKIHRSETQEIEVVTEKNKKNTEEKTKKNTEIKAKENKKENTGVKAKKGTEPDAFVETIVSRRNVSTSDTLKITYRLHTTTDISKIAETNFPYLKKDFYTRDITPKKINPNKLKKNGKEYYIFDIHQLILQPRTEGKKTVPEGSITIEFRVPTGKTNQSFFDDEPVYRIEQRKLQLNGTTIDVMNMVGI